MMIFSKNLKNFSFLFLSGIIPVILSACSGDPSSPTLEGDEYLNLPAAQQEAHYRSRSSHNHYAPPGPKDDPWGPYIAEASERFDVPQEWIKGVILQESGGHLYDKNGKLITSGPGAMGLMQLMAPSYDMLRRQYNLGPDPYDPHDNIMAGTAYIRQMYDIYGSPGFLAAYNNGPGNLDRYLKRNARLPKETRNYVASVGPLIAGTWPRFRSRADLMVSRYSNDIATRRLATKLLNKMPPNAKVIDTIAYTTYTTDSAVDAKTTSKIPNNVPPLTTGQRELEPPLPAPEPALPESALVPPRQPPERPLPESALVPPRHVAAQHTTTPHSTTKSSVTSSKTNSALDREIDKMRNSTNAKTSWSVQLGAYPSIVSATVAVKKLKIQAGWSLSDGTISITPVHTAGKALYRGRVTGLNRGRAELACRRVKPHPCFVVAPEKK
ncbi:lytic transglycosylase domain-containing protein [Acetobacteraceae bacterium]|nr:lytic transglycosylase domain-containing protein [Acetobacteraceae bacterium]